MEIKYYAPYIGLRLRGLSHYLWFEQGKYRADALRFRGKHGWGKAGVATNLDCLLSEIKSVIYSDVPQY